MIFDLPDIDPTRITTLEQAKQAIIRLLNGIEKLTQQNTLQAEQIRFLKEENALLKRQPPAPPVGHKQESIQYSATKFVSPKGKKQWSKTSKKGTIPIDREVALEEVIQCTCGSCEFTTIRTHEKIVQDIVIQRNNTRYSGKDKRCANCGKIYPAAIPADVKGVSFGSELRTWLSYFKYEGRMTMGKVADFLSHLGISISRGEISEMLLANSRKLAGTYAHLCVWGIKLSIYLGTDATGIRRREKWDTKGTNQHLHILGHNCLSIFKITRHYNSGVLHRFLGKRGREKLFISDDGSPNGEKLRLKWKQLCWIHEIRHYLKITAVLGIHKQKLLPVIEQLRYFYHLAKDYREHPIQQTRIQLEALFDRITTMLTGFDLLDHRLTLTRKKRSRLLVFLDHPAVPIHNNQCEQDLRDAVRIKHISRETKSKAGDRSFERHLSIIQTIRKQELDVFSTLHGLLTGQLSPFVLTAKRIE